MVRIGLCLYLMFSMLAGPALCCCAPARLILLFNRATNEQLPPSPTGGCCCHHRSTQEHQQQFSSGDKTSGKPARPDRSSCPCREEGSQRVALLSPNPETSQQQHPLDRQLQSQFLTVAVVALKLEGAGQVANELPFLTTQDILHALHILRC